MVAFSVTCNNHTTGLAHRVGDVTLDGQITFGPLHDAAVTVFDVNADGTNGKQIGAAVSAADGSFGIHIGRRKFAPLRIVVTGGIFKSEFDGTDVDIGTCTFSCLLSGLKGGHQKVSIDPVSDIVNALAMGQLPVQKTVTGAHDAAKALIAAYFGMTGDIERVIPSFDPAAIGTEEFKYGIVLGALDTLAKSLDPAARCEALLAISQDATDGLFDGMNNGVQVPLGAGFLPSTAATSDFLTALNNYTTTGDAIVSQGIDPTTLAPAITDIKNGVANSSMTPPAVGVTSGSSGAISNMSFKGKQYVYIAARTEGVVRIDVTDPLATSPTIDVWSSLYTNTFNSQEIGGVIPLQGADHPQIFVFAYNSKHFALVDADTGNVDSEGDLAIGAANPVNFSGGSAFIAGGIPDTGRDGVWLATADGYYFFNRVTQQLEKLYTIDCPDMLAENLGGDVGHGILWCPNYLDFNCNPPAFGGVQLVDLNADKSYYMDDTAFDTLFRSQGLDYCDAGSVDGQFQVGIITNEDTDNVGFINLATISRKDNTAPTLSTFTPATTNGAAHLHLTPDDNIELSGSAVDATTHLVLMMAGYSTDIAVGQLTKPSEFHSTAWPGFKDWRYNRLTGYNYARDPHAVAAFTNLSNSKAYGYLLDGGFHRALQVDLAAVMALTPDPGVDGHQYTGDLVAGGQIINRDW